MVDDRNGLSRSGRDRLDQIERQQDRLVELMGALGNKMDVYAERQNQVRDRFDRHDVHHVTWEADHGAHVRDHEKRHEDHEDRHRTLDWKVAGLLAGLVTAAVGIIWQGGSPI